MHANNDQFLIIVEYNKHWLYNKGNVQVFSQGMQGMCKSADCINPHKSSVNPAIINFSHVIVLDCGRIHSDGHEQDTEQQRSNDGAFKTQPKDSASHSQTGEVRVATAFDFSIE